MALEVILLKQPYEVSFSGTPMPYHFAITPYGTVEKTQDIRLQIRFYVEDAFASNFFTEVHSQIFYPNASGSVAVDIQGIIDPFLEYYRPKPLQINPAQAFQQRKRYKILYTLQKDNAIVGNAVESDILYAIKGGMAYEYWHPSEFFTDAILTKKIPLLFAAKGEKTGMDEKRFMYWIYPLDDNAVQTIVFSLFLNDNTQVDYVHPKTIFCGKWGICCVPVGFLQAGLAALVPAGKYVVKYTVQVIQGAFAGTNITTEDGFSITTENDLNIIVDNAAAGAGLIVAPYIFYIDHRNFYNTYQLLYRNSLGSLETLRLRGQVDFEGEYTKQQSQRIVPPSYFSNMNFLAQTTSQYNEEEVKATGDTGFVSRALNIKLRDLFLAEEVYELRKNRLLPVNIISKNTKFFSNKDNLVNTQIQWQLAFSNKYFTPDGLMPQTRACPAVQKLSVKQITKNKLQIMYALFTPYDKVEVKIITPSGTETFILTGNSGSVIQPFTNPATTTPVDITIEARTICDEDADPMDKGPATSMVLSVIANSLPVANNDTFSISGGYNSMLQLPGSVLDNDYDPDGDPLEVVVNNGLTSAAGLYEIDAAGIVKYFPLNGFTGVDSFTYQVREVGGTTLVTGTVYINVAPAGAGGGGGGVTTGTIYVSRQGRNFNKRHIGASIYQTDGEAWLVFYSDPSGTIPVDITGLGLVVNVRKDTATLQGNTIENIPVNCTGTEIKFYDGMFDMVHRYGNAPQTHVTFITLPGAGYHPLD